MRIGIFDPYLDDLGGGEKYMMSIASYLSQKHKVDVFWDNSEDLKGLIKRFSLDVSYINLVKNIFTPQTSTWQRLIITRNYDVIIFLSDGSIPIVMSKRLLVHVQQPLKIMQTKSILDRLKVGRVNKFFCNSEFTRTFIESRFNLKTTVLYPPIDLKPKKLKKENIILHVGRFRVKNVQNDDYKKQGVMVQVFKDMVDDGLKDWRFILAVSVNEKDRKIFFEFQKSAKGYPIEFLINESNDELWGIYSKAKIYWHASGYGENLDLHPEFAEHFGISTVEAMGAGVVPVVINAGGQKEIVKEGENGFLWDSLDQLESKTKKLIGDSDLLSRISKNSIESAKAFSKNKFYEAVDLLIRS